MTDRSPEQSLAQFLNPEDLGVISQPSSIPNGAARILGGIGLGGAQETKLPDNKTYKRPEKVRPEEVIKRIEFGLQDRFDGYKEASEKFNLESVCSEELFDSKLKNAIEAWTKDGTLDYAAQEIDKNNNWFDLVAAPLIQPRYARLERLIMLAEGFIPGQTLSKIDQSHRKIAETGVQLLTQYASSELYGQKQIPSATMSFMLQPGKTPLPGKKATASQQQQSIHNLIEETGISFAIPTITETLYGWYESRMWERKQSMIDEDGPYKLPEFDNTAFVNLPPKLDQASGELAVPNLRISKSTDLPSFGVMQTGISDYPTNVVIGRIHL